MDFRRVLRYKDSIMLRFLSGFFRREPLDPDATPEERWTADFSKPHTARFREEQGESYEATMSRRGLDLRLKRAHLFAWVENPLYRYSNAVIEAVVRFPVEGGADPGYSAAGILFRYSDAGSYYSFLVSTKGFFRLDAVFNGSPLPLIGWTECPEPRVPGKSVRLCVIALGDRLSFIIDDRWAAEIEDGTLSTGHTAFAAASYDETADVVARLESFRIDSRPLETEALHYRWNSYIRVDPDSRTRLAETFLSMGQPMSALVQLKRVWKADARNAGALQRKPKDLLLAADCAMRLSLLDEAEEYLDRCVEADSQSEEARRATAEKAKLLYLSNRFAELREHIEEAIDFYPEDSTLRTLLGHAYWNLGSWERASQSYEKARELDPGNGLIALNAARARERLGDAEGSFERYLAAANFFLRMESYGDLTETLPRLKELKPNHPDVLAVSGKRAYAVEDWKTAEKDLSAAAAVPGNGDSAVYYLLALLRIREGRRQEALPLLERAAEMESDFPTYRFRLAETRFLLSGDPDDPKILSDLAKALELSPEDGWTANLAGQIAIARGDLASAALYTEKAAAALPDEPAVLVNRAELAFLGGDVEKALALLGGGDDRAGTLANAAGNILVRAERWEEAVAAYGRALALSPEDPDFLRNRASCLIQLGRYGEADDSLARLIEIEQGARTFDLIAYVSIKKGEYPRAEAAYRVGLERYPEDKALLAGLAWAYLSMGRWDSAETTIAKLESLARGSNTVAELRAQLTEATTKRIACASCEHSWRVLKDARPAAPFRLVAEPPDELPAGTCPNCGKTYCIGCGKKRLEGGRFVCPDCGERLKLTDEGLKKLLSDWANGPGRVEDPR